MGVRRVRERVPLDEAVRRAVEFGDGRGPLKAHQFAYAVWPGAEFLNTQGAALAASRVIAELRRQKRVRWRRDGSVWGWEIVRPTF